MRLIDADALRQVLEVFTEKDTLGHTPLQLCDAMPTVNLWHRVEEKPKDCQRYFVAYRGPVDFIYDYAVFHNDVNSALDDDVYEDGTAGFVCESDDGPYRTVCDYWMPIEPPKEDA